MNWDKIRNNIIGAKNLASIGISDLIGTGLSSIFWFYLASVIDTNNFGQIHYFLGFTGVAYLMALFATQTVIIVFVAKNLKLESTLFFISLSAGVTSSLIVFFIINRIDASLLVLGFIINELASGYLLGKKLYTDYTKYVLLQKIFMLIFCIGLFYLLGSDGIIYGLFLSYLHFMLIIFRGFKTSKISFSLIKPKLGFIIDNYAINLAGVFRNHFDKLIIGQIFGFSILGNYALATQMFAVLMTFSNIVTKYVLPEDASGNYNKKLKKLTVAFSGLVTIFGVIVLPLAIQAFFPKYIESISILRIMSLGVISATIGQIYSSRLLATEKSKHVMLGRWISAIIMVVSILILGSLFGSVGLATSFVLSTTIYVVYLIIIGSLIKKKNLG